jgi:hypothetical protein
VGVECRAGGAPGSYQIIAAFPAAVSVTSASVTSGVGNVGGLNVAGSVVTADLTGVANVQTIVLTLSVNDGTMRVTSSFQSGCWSAIRTGIVRSTQPTSAKSKPPRASP